MTDQIIQNYCRNCRNYNRHFVLFQKQEEADESNFNPFKNAYMMLSCCGCNTICFRHDSEHFEYDLDDEELDSFTETQIFPPSIEGHRDLELMHLVPEDIASVYYESISAFKNNCKILAGAGFRAVIEAICIDKKIKGRTLEYKINNLQKEGLINKNECDRLHSIRFLGNDSIHEMKRPMSGQLLAVLRIVEHLLSNIYIIDKSTSSILDKPISSFSDFINFLESKLSKYKVNDELPLIDILGKDIRRVKEHFATFEKELLAKINDGYKFLTLGGIKPYKNTQSTVQHFIIIEVPPQEDDLPF